jgi:outer membrane protein TolC
MQKTNAVTPLTASGVPNIGLFVGLNLPIYRKKLAAGVCEAQARAAADSQLYEAERDQTHRDVKDALIQARVQQNVLDLLRRSNLPNSRKILQATSGDFRAGNVDYLGVLNAWRDVLQVELQIAQVESELGKALAALERAVGAQLNEHPPDRSTLPGSGTDRAPEPPDDLPAIDVKPGPFKPGDQKKTPEAGHMDIPGAEPGPSRLGGTRNG